MERLSRAEDRDSSKSIPLQRWGEVHEIADATVFLCSQAGSFITGDIIVVDGGSWHRKNSFIKYPDMLLAGTIIEGVKGMKSKL
jgi:peroxisomal 2,4-dienoyl-CoA reductase